MNRNEIIAILNRRVFEKEKATSLQAIIDNPDRYDGLFRSTTPHLKLLQNILQSREIRFGDALEEIITELIAAMGFIFHAPGAKPPPLGGQLQRGLG